MSRAASLDEAIRQSAEEAALKAGVQIRLLRDLADMAEAESLFDRVWGPGGVTVPLLRTLGLTDNYIAGAWAHDQLVGASVAFLSASTPTSNFSSRSSTWGSSSPGTRRASHLHIMSVLGPAQGSGVGFALLSHQRAWAMEHGVDEITWMFDPLVRRNGWFATVKVGAKVGGYYPDFFGYLNDPVNRWDYTDRCIASWPVDTSPSMAGESAGDEPSEEAVLILGEDPDGQPWLNPAPWVDHCPPVLLCQVPADTHGLRQSNPKLARQWLSALRGTLGRAIDCGYQATSMTREGRYVLTRPAS